MTDFRDELEMLLATKLITDKGIMKTLWNSYKEEMLADRNLQDETIDLFRSIFYSGMCGLFKAIMDSPDSEIAARIVQASLNKEFSDYLDEIKGKKEEIDKLDPGTPCPCPICRLSRQEISLN